MASGVDNLIERLASTKVEEEKDDTEVSFVGLALTLDTEEDAADIVKAINDCPGMTTLRLDGNTIGIPAAKAIAKALETQPHFKNALWKDMFTRRDKLEIPKALDHLSNGIMIANARLVVLDLSDNAFGPRGLVGIQKLLESPCCFTLQELHLNNNGLGISGAKLVSESICNCINNSRQSNATMQLRVFVCGRNRLENDGAKAVSKFLGQFGTLESVAMPQNGIYAPGVKDLSEAFACNPNLRVINLEDNTLTEEGATYVAGCLKKLPKIEMLNLGDCIIRTNGAVAVASALKHHCPDLRDLNLGFNEIGLEGGVAVAEAMEKKEKLQNVVLNGNNFGDEGCEFVGSKFGQIGKLDMLGSLSEDEGEEEEEDDEIDEEEGQFEDDDDNDYNSEENDTNDEIKVHHIPMKNPNAHRSPMLAQTATPQEFLANPSPGTLVQLSKSNEDFTTVLPAEPTARDYIDLFFKISLAVTFDDTEAKLAACRYADDFLAKAYGLCTPTEFNDIFLVSIGVLKDEEKKTKKGLNISGTLLVLEHCAKQPYFHASTRDVLQFFLGRPLLYVTVSEKAKHLLMQTLFQI